MDKIRKEVEKLLEEEQRFVKHAERSLQSRGSDIDFGMGKIRAFERVLELLK